METEKQSWLINQLRAAPQTVKQFLVNQTGNRFVRPIYAQLKAQLNDFLNSGHGSRWLIMPGLRGVGKTTLLSQLFTDKQLAAHSKFYLSLDVAKRINANMLDLEAALTQLLDCPLTDYRQPLFIFLDEVHFMPDWSLAVKTWVDRLPRLFVVCTGSSALALQTNADIARRADTIKINPLSLMEFVAIKQASAKMTVKQPDQELSRHLNQALFQSADVDQVGQRLTDSWPVVQSYWKKLQPAALIDDYLLFGSLPFVVALRQTTNHQAVWRRVAQTLDSVLLKDIALVEGFNRRVLATFPKLLTLLSHSQARSLHKLSRDLDLNIGTLQTMMDVLASNEIITAVRPRGATLGHVRKTYKYYFNAPASRSALVHELGSTEQLEAIKGYLLEDAVVACLKRSFLDQPLAGILEYDPSQGGADLIVSKTGLKKQAVVIEVGLNKSTGKQVTKTLKEGGKYGLVVTNLAQTPQPGFRVDQANKTVFVDLSVYLLT